MTDDDTRPPVTVLGLGAMGRALAETFLVQGHPLTVWNRTPGKADDLAAKGARVAPTPAEALEASPVTVVCLLDYGTVHEVLDPVAGALAGRTLVNLTNGTPRQAREAAGWAAGHGADYLDGGIMAVPPMIGGPGAFVLYSGSRPAFTAHEGTLGGLGDAHFLGEDPGRASLYDLALLTAMYGMFGGFFHAAALVDSAGEPVSEFAPMVVRWLTAMLGGLPEMARAHDERDLSDAASNLEMQATAYVNLLDVSRDQGVSTELAEPLGALLRRGVAAGFGAGPVSSLITLLKENS
ncbi:3-hydroxyisobutyrate dehydrogenase-like beta-hydroxyacid dehydrogenase [Thermocatellispora tengchongensis]|uniref:3-hydroxyisobutyrate dehydrogenase-like beta-hydroxyacid dehydrogenase n=1 Tax=Thermocatellispora tengchongensis TaxID=1073253 RepID=A0A840PET5_9ACTN|nr:NAD(P)-binding domain-containing protein [Thermocatellispora tengchongensis]MBB5139934.1 3-hydroxyisobutyrate dehydrogenase-like beta-hydroxyacid dehydrogenase [Thermocatellispora tengchongensis]